MKVNRMQGTPPWCQQWSLEHDQEQVHQKNSHQRHPHVLSEQLPSPQHQPAQGGPPPPACPYCSTTVPSSPLWPASQHSLRLPTTLSSPTTAPLKRTLDLLSNAPPAPLLHCQAGMDGTFTHWLGGQSHRGDPQKSGYALLPGWGCMPPAESSPSPEVSLLHLIQRILMWREGLPPLSNAGAGPGDPGPAGKAG